MKMLKKYYRPNTKVLQSRFGLQVMQTGSDWGAHGDDGTPAWGGGGYNGDPDPEPAKRNNVWDEFDN